LNKKTILFILPELSNPGGMELENLGFIAALQQENNLNVRVLNFYINPIYYKNINFKAISLPFYVIVRLFFSLRFLKIYIKSGGKLSQSLANLSFNFPQLLGGFLSAEVSACDLCFMGIRPGNFLHLVHDLAKKEKKAVLYHEVSKFNPKHHSFFEKVNSYGTFLISGIEKKIDLQKIFPMAKTIEINQWLYDGQKVFLQLQEVDPKRMFFGVISRLDFGKNLEVLLEAVAILKNNGENPKLLVFGDGPELEKLKRLVKSLGIESFVEFLGMVKFEDRKNIYEGIDVFVMNSLIEGGPITVLEAMAAARPVISSNVGDVPNRVISGFNGYILNSPSDPNELAEKMSVYLKDPKLTLDHGKNSRLKFIKDFDEQEGKNKFMHAITQMINS
jgi:glycosyltransferase involved in cell wall biosynthesis